MRQSPFCIVRLKPSTVQAARALIERSVLSKAIYELWGAGTGYSNDNGNLVGDGEGNGGGGRGEGGVHADVRRRSAHLWPRYKTCSFRFDVDAYQGKRSEAEKRRLIESFSYVGFDGPIVMRGAAQRFCIFEERVSGGYASSGSPPPPLCPPSGDGGNGGDGGGGRSKSGGVSGVSDGSGNDDSGNDGGNGNGGDSGTVTRVYLARWLADGGRAAVRRYSLKRRAYIATTSMDAELALVTANAALAAPGRLFYDPFAGTGGFPLACAHFGAVAAGSDIDGRTIRGTGACSRAGCVLVSVGSGVGAGVGAGAGAGIAANFAQYGLAGRWLDGFIADVTQSPVRRARWLDGIVCDPPYGVREGLRVLGHRDPERSREATMFKGKALHLYAIPSLPSSPSSPTTHVHTHTHKYPPISA
jgi:tRNA (guanine10-N2)-methyltransferase